MTTSLLFFTLTLAANDPGAAGQATPTPDEEVLALKDAYQAADDAFVKANREAKTGEDRAKLSFRPWDLMPPFLELARRNPRTSAAEDALLWITTHAMHNDVCAEAKRLLARDFAASPKLGPALGFQGHYADYSATSEAFFRTVLAKNPDPDLRGLAAYWLARHLRHNADGARRIRRDSDFAAATADYDRRYAGGEGWADRLRRLAPDALEAAADSLYERVIKFHAATPHNDKRRNPGTLGDAARSILREIRVLAVGKPAPDIQGTDLDGRPFRLKGQRGKVVLLDFGSHFFCGACHEMYPVIRNLAKRYQGRPFVVVSINAEPGKDLKQLKDAWTEAGNGWPCILDGGWEGPIQKAWNITFFPTLYVVDATGIIRLKGTLGDDYAGAIEKLVNEAEKINTD